MTFFKYQEQIQNFIQKTTLVFFVLTVSFLFTIFSPLKVSALTENDINAKISPETPGPNQAVTVTLSSSATSLDESQIKWTVAGKILKQGKGEKSAILTTSSIGNPVYVGISITPPREDTVTKELTIVPAELDILWQADTYTPPFYEGKALFTYQSNITFIANPNIVGLDGKKVSPENLIYTWKKNGMVQGTLSGYGKQTFALTAPIIPRPINIEVEAVSPSGIRVLNKIEMTAKSPSLLVYKESPLYGIQFEKAVSGQFEMTNTEESFVAVPFFFSASNAGSPSLSYKWQMNGVEIKDLKDKSSAVFRQNSDQAGMSQILLRVQNVNDILQGAEQSFFIKYNPQNNSGF